MISAAKYEGKLTGNFNEFLSFIDNEVLKGSISASFEDGSNYCVNGVYCAVRVYERYSMMGGNRVSLNITLIGQGNNLFISVITSGGSQALFFKVNTLGEESFLEEVIDAIKKYKNRK